MGGPPVPLAAASDDLQIGGKARHLRWLVDHGFQVPATWVVPAGTAEPIDFAELPKRPGRYAVRSSADVEDGTHRSWAGQFTTVLDVEPTTTALEAAYRAVAESIGSATAASYHAKDGDADPIAMGVVIQRMVDPVYSGVAFSKNPVTGIGEVVIEAIAGRGDRLVGEGATPMRWVHRWGDFVEEPETSSVPADVVTQLVAGTEAIAEARGEPVDLEWVFDGTELWWVQMRPITGLESVAIYSNRISKEVMPGLIKPLVWSVNVPVVNRAWIQLFTEAIGRNRLQPEDLAKSFGYRSYFNMGAIGDIFETLGMPRESLELLIGLPPGSEQPSFTPTAKTFRKLPRLIAFAIRKARYGRVADVAVPDLEATYHQYDRRDLATMSDNDIVDTIHSLMELGTQSAYINIVVPLLANLYSTLLRKRLDKRGIDLAEVDLMEGVIELEHYDPNPALDRLGAHLADQQESEDEVDRFLERFGHLSDSGNDFSASPWREQRDLVTRMAARHSAAKQSSTRIGWDDVERQTGPLSRPTLRALRKRARAYRLRREEISYVYTYGYGLFRPYFLELGDRLATRGMVEDASDIFYLAFNEVKQALEGDDAPDGVKARIGQRKAEIERFRDVEMPPIIYGDDYVPTPSPKHGSVRHGVGTSRGHYRGPLRVVHGIADFEAVAEGDVIAIPYSDVGWTPLFAKAGAVIAESGGMLSHSSIVAREYGIPCVVSVPGATRLPSGSVVTVDGYTGAITIEDQPSSNTR